MVENYLKSHEKTENWDTFFQQLSIESTIFSIDDAKF